MYESFSKEWENTVNITSLTELSETLQEHDHGFEMSNGVRGNKLLTNLQLGTIGFKVA